MNRLLATSPRYLAVSATCLILNTLLLVGLDRSGLHYTVAVIISGLIFIPVSFFLHLLWTYRIEGGWRSFVRYAAAQTVNTPIAIALFYVIHDRFSMPMSWAAPMVIGIMFSYNIFSSFWALVLRAPRPELR